MSGGKNLIYAIKKLFLIYLPCSITHFSTVNPSFKLVLQIYIIASFLSSKGKKRKTSNLLSYYPQLLHDPQRMEETWYFDDISFLFFPFFLSFSPSRKRRSTSPLLSPPRESREATVDERCSKITTLWPATSRHKYGTDGGSGATIWTVSGQRWGARSVTSVDPSLRGLYRFDQNSQHHVDAAKYGNRYPCSCVPTRHAFFSSSSFFLNRFHDRFEISFPGLRHRFSLHSFSLRPVVPRSIDDEIGNWGFG